MKNYLKYATLVGKLSGLLGWIGTIPGIDERTGALIFAISSIAKDLVNRVCDYIDNGKLDDSWKPQGPDIILVLVLAGLLTACSMNNPKFRSEIHGTNGVVEIRTLSIPTIAIWPATTDLAKQKASLSTKSFSVGTDGLKEDGGGTNMVEALKALDSILGKVR